MTDKKQVKQLVQLQVSVLEETIYTVLNHVNYGVHVNAERVCHYLLC